MKIGLAISGVLVALCAWGGLAQAMVLPQHGDANFDGLINAKDAKLALEWGAGFPEVRGLEPCPDGVGNVNLDGAFDALDAQLILQFVAGELESLPVFP